MMNDEGRENLIQIFIIHNPFSDKKG
jgi:hypothetical protein